MKKRALRILIGTGEWLVYTFDKVQDLTRRRLSLEIQLIPIV